MGISKRPKLWASAGAAALLAAGCADPAEPAEPAGADAASTTSVETPEESGVSTASVAEPPEPAAEETAPETELAAAMTSAEGEGEGEGEGAGGGEFGVDVEAAQTDPVVYLTAIEVMRAHYLAGVDALNAGERAAGAEMFAHPISEIYVHFEPVLEARGAPLFEDEMTAAAVAPYEGASPDEIAARVDAVLAAMDAAAALAPEGERSAAGVEAAVIADLVERAALQYQVVAAGSAGEAYLDGYGFARAAARLAEGAAGTIASADADAGAAVERALAVLAEAFPTATEPATLTVDAGQALAAAEAARAAAEALS